MIRIVLAVLIITVPLASLAQDPDQGNEAELMTLRQAVFLALQNNLDIEAARYEPFIADQLVDQARGVFDPIAGASSSFAHNEVPVSSSLETSTVEADTWGYEGGVGGILPVGLTYSSGYQMTRDESSSFVQSFEREWRAVWRSDVTLPLLRDLIDNEASIAVKRSRVARDFSDEQFRQRLTDLIFLVEASYWELAAARADHRVAQKSLQTAQDLLEQTRVQYEVGVVSKVAVTQAEAGVAEREVTEIIAKNRLETAHDQLLNAVLAPEARVFSERQVVTEDPTFTDYVINEEISLKKAMALRPELAQAQKLLEDAELALNLAENQVRPRLDLVASYTFNGLSGKPKLCGETLCGSFPGAVPTDPAGPDLGGAGDAHSAFFRSDGARSWSIRGQFEIPIGNTTAEATEVQRRIELRRTYTGLRRTEQDVILDVRRATRFYRNSVEAYEAAERRRIAQQETLAAEQERLRLGDSTPFQVLEFEEDLAEAERQVIDSLQVHRDAISGLERAQGTLLERNSISFDDQLMR